MSRKPEYEFIPITTDELEAEMIAGYESLSGETVTPASPERLMIAWVASVILADRVRTNYAANQNLPSRAEGANLDALAELYYAQERPGPKAARCTVRFTISEAQGSAVLIPAGTRVTDAGQALYWETADDAWVPAGETSIDLTVRCQTSGAIGNGWAAGQICAIVDVYDYYAGCHSVTASDGGADAATDDELYKILKASMAAYSTAGPRGAYAYHAKAVSTQIADVAVVRPRERHRRTLNVYTRTGVKYAFLGGEELLESTLEVYPHGSEAAAVAGTDYTTSYADNLLTIEICADGAVSSSESLDIIVDAIGAGKVALYCLMEDGEIAGEEIKAAVQTACSDDMVRPLSDRVTVEDPDIVPYSIALTYYTQIGSAESASELRHRVEQAVATYTAWQSGRLGRDINPSYLIGLLMQTGIKRVEVTSPIYRALRDGSDGQVPQVAALGTVTITAGGAEHE